MAQGSVKALCQTSDLRICGLMVGRRVRQEILRRKALGLAAWWFPEQVKKKATYGWRTSQDGSIAGNLIHPSINQTAGFFFPDVLAGKKG